MLDHILSLSSGIYRYLDKNIVFVSSIKHNTITRRPVDQSESLMGRKRRFSSGFKTEHTAVVLVGGNLSFEEEKKKKLYRGRGGRGVFYKNIKTQ